MLKTFEQLESLLARKGFRHRFSNESFFDYARSAAAGSIVRYEELKWFARTASAAAYCPGEFPDDSVRDARARLRRIRAVL